MGLTKSWSDLRNAFLKSDELQNWVQTLKTATTPYDLPSLVYRRYRGDMIEVYKFTHEIYSSGHSLLPRAPQSGRRGHDYKLMKRRWHSQLRANFFSFRVVNLWNRLPSDVVSAPSVNAFKSRLDNYLKDFCYTLDPEDLLWW